MLQGHVSSTTGLWSFPPPMVPSRELKMCRFGSGNWFCAQFAMAGEMLCRCMIWLVFSVFLIEPIISISPGGLLLEVPHLLAVQVLVLWVGLQISK